VADDIAYLGFDIDSAPALGAAKNLLKLEDAAAKADRSAAKLETSFRKSNGQFQKASDYARQNAAEIRSLAAQYNAGLAAELKFADAQKEVARAVKLGVIAADQQDAVLERLQAQYIATANAATRTGAAFGGMHAGAGNVFAQLNDIGVMMASGQNPFILALQQGTQLNQVWASMGAEGRKLSGVWGMLRAGIMQFANPMGLATIAVIAGTSALVQWGVAALGAGEEGNKFDDALDAIGTTIDNMMVPMDILKMSMFDLEKTYGESAIRVRKMAVAQAELNASMAATRLDDQINAMDEMVAAYGRGVDASDEFGEKIDISEALRRLRTDLKLSEKQALSMFEMFNALDNASNFDEQQNAMSSILQYIRDQNIEMGQLPGELQRALNEMITLSNETDRARKAMADLRAEASNVSVGIGWIFNPATDMPPPRRPGGGGGGGGNSRQRELEAFIESLMTEREQLEQWRTEQMALLAQYNESELEAIGGHNEAKLRLEQEYQSRLADLQKQQYEGVRSAREGALSAFQDFMGTLSGDSKAAAVALLAVNTALSISQAIQNTAVAATRALAELGPIAGPAAAAKIKAYGAAQVAMIAANAALRVGSMGGGGSGAPTGVSSTSTASTPTREVRISFDGPAWARDLVEGLASQLFDATGDGTRVVIAR
jgi:hypothetical protein